MIDKPLDELATLSVDREAAVRAYDALPAGMPDEAKLYALATIVVALEATTNESLEGVFDKMLACVRQGRAQFGAVMPHTIGEA